MKCYSMEELLGKLLQDENINYIDILINAKERIHEFNPFKEVIVVNTHEGKRYDGSIYTSAKELLEEIKKISVKGKYNEYDFIGSITFKHTKEGKERYYVAYCDYMCGWRIYKKLKNFRERRVNYPV